MNSCTLGLNNGSSSEPLLLLEPVKIFATRPDVLGQLECFMAPCSDRWWNREWKAYGKKNHLKHDYPLQLSERETHWVSSVRGDTSCNILFAKENHKVHVKCYYLKLEYLSATKRCVEVPLLWNTGSNLRDQLDPQWLIGALLGGRGLSGMLESPSSLWW